MPTSIRRESIYIYLHIGLAHSSCSWVLPSWWGKWWGRTPNPARGSTCAPGSEQSQS